MIEIDGSDGGGQILRSACTLAALTGQKTRVEAIRGNRPEPGLKAQHRTAIETLAEVCDDTVLPLAVACDSPVAITVEGGTEVKWSPPLFVHDRVKLPICRRIGLQAAIERRQTGFYPAGGGSATLWLAPSSLSPLQYAKRGELEGARVYSLSSANLADDNVATRQAKRAESRLEHADIPVTRRDVSVAETDSPGSALGIELRFEETRAAFDALGEPGKPAEDVADEAVEQTLNFRAGTAAVDVHLADQLLIVLALAGGDLRLPELTNHVQTSLELLDTFGFDVAVDTAGDAPLLSV